MPEGTARLDDLARDERAATIPVWGQVIGAVLLVVFVALSIEAYFGPGLRHRLPSFGIGAQSQPQTVPPRVFYEPGSTVRVGQKSVGSEGQDRVIQAGDVVLLGASGQLVVVASGGRVTDLQAADGASTMVANLGAWDRAAERLTGVPARYQAGRWAVDEVQLPSVGTELHPAGAPDESLTDGFWIGPDPEVGRVRRVGDRDRPAVRIRANKKAPSLTLESRLPLPALDGMLVSVSALVRGQSRSDLVLSVEDVANAGGDVVGLTDRRPATEEWTRLTVRRRVILPTSVDRIAVGLVGVEEGDWFEVRDFDVLLGVAP